MCVYGKHRVYGANVSINLSLHTDTMYVGGYEINSWVGYLVAVVELWNQVKDTRSAQSL